LYSIQSTLTVKKPKVKKPIKSQDSHIKALQDDAVYIQQVNLAEPGRLDVKAFPLLAPTEPTSPKRE